MGNSRCPRFSPLAEADLEDIWLYTFRQWSIEQADEYVRSIITAIDGLTAGRNIAQRAEVREGYWKYKVGMHVVYFQSSDRHLDVIRILHERMEVDSHLERQS